MLHVINVLHVTNVRAVPGYALHVTNVLRVTNVRAVPGYVLHVSCNMHVGMW